jgi:hypothetical protein
MKTIPRLLLTIAVSLTLLTGARAAAEVTRVEVKSRGMVGTSGYEKIVGTLHFAIDPKDPRNARIADVEKAPVNAAGRVEFSADMYSLRPVDPAKSNGVALVDVLNRGNKIVLRNFNRSASADPVTDADLGDGFLMSQGYTVVWVGWEFDTRIADNALRATVPAAQGVTGVVRAGFVPNDREPQTVGDLAGYRPSANTSDITLTVRDSQYGPAESIARDRFTLSGNQVTLTGGFEPGRMYELTYRPEQWPVAGLGLAAYRDSTAWIRYAPDALVHASKTVAFGSSQSGRFLRTFLYDGFNTDEQGRQVLDGAMIHIAGAARLSINERGAQPTALTMYAATAYPFAVTAEPDPITGRREGLLDNDRARAHQPKIFFTNSAVEYWGGGRSAALVHTSADGKRDLTIPDNVRIYYLTGSQHGPARFPTTVDQGQQPGNPVEHVWTLRALLTGMTNWVKEGTAPPASRYPRISDGTLVPVAKVAFPAIPGVQAPGIISPLRIGNKQLPFLVPQVGPDGNELGGVRIPEQKIALQTYTGWNFRNPSIGGTKLIVNLLGSAIPLPATKAERAARKDPRPSIEELYPTREAYLAAAKDAADALVKGGYLRSEDAPKTLDRVEEQWSHAVKR